MAAFPPAPRELAQLALTLTPHRSLGPRGFAWLMAFLGGVGALASLLFWSLGAWPVSGFLGLDILGVWLAFRLNYASAKAKEHITLYDDRLEIERIDARGRRRLTTLQPYWLRVQLDASLTLCSHGRTTEIGAFLAPYERIELAQRLRDALARWRQSPSTSRIE